MSEYSEQLTHEAYSNLFHKKREHYFFATSTLYNQYNPDAPTKIYTICMSKGLVPNMICMRSILNAPTNPQLSAPTITNTHVAHSNSFIFIFIPLFTSLYCLQCDLP